VNGTKRATFFSEFQRCCSIDAATGVVVNLILNFQTVIFYMIFIVVRETCISAIEFIVLIIYCPYFLSSSELYDSGIIIIGDYWLREKKHKLI